MAQPDSSSLVIPHTIHLMYFPWDRDQRLLEDKHAFDHTPYKNMLQYAPGFEVLLWTYDKAKEFGQQHYPDIWETVESLARPTMMVDVMRWLVVYHFGGIYWQYDMTPLCPMERVLPSLPRTAKLFTEFVLSEEQCLKATLEPIRNGEPEEPTRVFNQAFAATPQHPFVKHVLDIILERCRMLTPKRDYDILYICANAAVSTAYDRHGKGDPTVELTSRPVTKKTLKLIYKGSWRTDAKPEPSPSLQPRRSSPSSSIKDVFVNAVRTSTAAKNIYYKLGKPHPHETVFARSPDDSSPTNHEATDGLMPRQNQRGALLQLTQDLVVQLGVQTILDCPCGDFQPNRNFDLKSIEYVGGDMVRDVVTRNTALYSSNNVSFRHMNLMYSRIPQVDLVVCRNFLNDLPYREIRTVLRRIVCSNSTYLLTTTFPLLNENWDYALGDWRPLNYALSPFSFTDPQLVIRDPDPDGRTDRSLGLWQLSDLAKSLEI